MLDQNLIDQLKGVFSKLTSEVELVLKNSNHEEQKNLDEMLTSVASTNENIKLTRSNEETLVPEFFIKYQGTPNGIIFKGVPGGHEFTSLILAILNSDGKGKLPDDLIIERIKNLKGPINIRTFISLTCENCPDVVQALNLMATLNKDFTHTMIDGAYHQEEATRLGIQGVPSVMNGDKLISSGKASFVELLEKCEKEFGSIESTSSTNKDLGEYDVIVLGAGPAGASAAVYTARKGLKTAVIAERVGGQVKDTKGIENLISVKYTEGPILASQLLDHMNEYGIKILEHRKVKNIEKGDLKTILLESGEVVKTKAIIVATGAKWRELNIPGEKDYIGRGVAFCPHCDGPFYKGKKVAVVGGGNSGVEAAIDLAGIVSEVVLFEYMDTLKADKVLVEKLKSLPNVSIVTNAKTEKVVGDGQKVIALEYTNRTNNEAMKVDLDGIFVQIGLLPNSQFLKETVELNKFGEIVIDNKCRTSEKGIYAAGDVTTVPYKQIIISMGEGAKAALAAFEDQMIH